jgi:hypothetical protein
MMLETERLYHIHGFLEATMEESIAYINLMNSPTCRNNNGDHCSNSYRFNNGAKSFRKINYGLLMEPFSY